MPGVHWAWCFHSGSWKLEATNFCVCDAWKLSCGTQQLQVLDFSPLTWSLKPVILHGICNMLELELLILHAACSLQQFLLRPFNLHDFALHVCHSSFPLSDRPSFLPLNSSFFPRNTFCSFCSSEYIFYISSLCGMRIFCC